MKLVSNMRNALRKNILKNKRGQGATEYILLLVVIVGLVMMFGPRIKKSIDGKIGDLDSKMNSEELK